jgi:protein tyrosine phosphatase (PTP) superfamily phosphohydrolase (DUF442 family)
VVKIPRGVWARALAILGAVWALLSLAIPSDGVAASARDCPPVTAPARSTDDSTAETAAGTGEGRRGSPGITCPREFPGLGNFAEVDGGKLYRSAQPTREGLQLARDRFGVRTVISFRSFHSDRGVAEELGLQYHRIPFAAWHVTSEDAVRFLQLATEPRNYPILVHCQHGADRTGTMVAVYRIFVQGWSTEQAIAELPRFGFHAIWANLKNFLRDEEWRRAGERAGVARQASRKEEMTR